MSIKNALTRRQALVLSSATAAGLALGGLPRLARGAPPTPPPLPIPALIDAHKGEPVILSLQKTHHRFGSGLPVPSTGISSSYLGPVVRVRSGDRIPFQVENHLDEETTLHWHGLMVPSQVDGGPHNTIKPGAVWTPEITVKQPPATTWFHPHPHRNTARQVYLGLAGMMIVSDGADGDRGLPATYGADDLPIVLQDKRFGRNGELVYAPTMMDLMHGFRGDTLLVNGAIGPMANVPASFVRLRLLNAANARNFDLRFTDRRPFFVIAGDGGLLSEPVEVRHLPISPAERYEILVNFSDGRPIELVTTSEARGGFGSGMMMQMGRPRTSVDETEMLMRFQPDSALKAAVTRLPRELATLASPDIKSAVVWRTFELDPMMGMMRMSMAGMGPMGSPGDGVRRGLDHGGFGGSAHTMGINGRSFAMDRIDVTAKLGTAEIWEIVSTAMAHPFHVHGATFRILSNNGRKPSPQQSGWKDVVFVEDRAELLVRFDNLAPAKMPFMYHCHILEHEDQGMMGQFAVV
jgi:FtsP/CotA-like multicopper oxidase with cupredoxin domain